MKDDSDQSMLEAWPLANRRRAAWRLVGIVTVMMSLACRDDGKELLERVAAIQAQAEPAENEWRHYLGDSDASHYSPLTQINRDNVSQLREIWRYDSGDAGDRDQTEMETNPLVIKGILYGLSPRNRLFALNAATGQELWRYQPPGVKKGRKIRLRGMAYWEDGDEQRLLFTAGHYLYAVDARSGQRLRGFGDGGRVDMRRGLDRAARSLEIKATSPGVVYRDLLIIGSSMSELSDAAPGHIRAYDVRSGELRWTFRTIPRQGEYGAETWPDGDRARNGGANSWAGITVDHGRGLAFVPTGSATFDFFGGDRPGDNLFANSLVALDASTGERRWHYQIVRHDLWDRDLPSPPNLIVVERDGERIPAVAQATKSGHLFVFHRETGEPLFPIEEIPVQGPGVTGEHVSVSQPLPLSPPPFTRQDFEPTNRSATMQAAVRQRLENLNYGAAYIAPTLMKPAVLYPGMDGGAEWGGSAYDPESGWLYINANEVPSLMSLTPTSDESAKAARTPHFAYVRLCSGCHGLDRRGDGSSTPSLVGISERMSAWRLYQTLQAERGRMPSFRSNPRYEKAAIVWYLRSVDDDSTQAQELATGDQIEDPSPRHYINGGWQSFTDPEGLPASMPPWGTLTAIDVNRGEIAWRIPLGDYPEILAAGMSGLGSENYGGPVVTAGGLLFIAAAADNKLRAFDRADGKLLWATELPNGGHATPSVYMAQGRQYVVIAAGGGKFGRSGSNYLAYALPR